MAQYNTTSTLDGLFKVVYGEGPINAVPQVAILQKKIPFKKSERIGKTYDFPVVLSMEQGVTYLAAGAGVSTLNTAIAATLKNASVDATQIIVRGQMDYEAAAKATSGKEAFKNASELLVQNLIETASKRQEIAFLYGRQANGFATADSSTNQSATATRITCLLAGWAPGIFAGMEGAVVNFYSGAGSLVSSGANADFTITSVDFDSRYVYVSGTSTGITALDSALGSADHYFFFKGAYGVEPVGIDAIATNTGTLFGISAATYALWKGSSYSFGSAAATTAKILNMASLAMSKGGLMEEADILLNPKTFLNLSGTMTDLRRQNGGQKETEGIAGFETITLMGPNGKLNLVPHPFVKESECFLIPIKRMKRVGSQEFSFETPGRSGELFLHVTDANAYELRVYGASAIICEKPAQIVKGTAIVNS